MFFAFANPLPARWRMNITLTLIAQGVALPCSFGSASSSSGRR